MAPPALGGEGTGPDEAELARINGRANAFLAKETGVALAAIEGARRQGYPFSHALFLACAASEGRGKVKLKRLVELHDEGYNWEQICGRLGLDFKAVAGLMRKVAAAMSAQGVEMPRMTLAEHEKLFQLKPKRE